MAKTFAIICGMFFCSLLGTFYYYIGWKGEAKQHAAIIDTNLKHMSSVWLRKARGYELAFDEKSPVGFPFSTRIKLFQPRMQLTLPNQIVLLSTAFIAFEPTNEPGKYRIDFPADFIMGIKDKGQPQENYFIHLSDVPQMYVQMHSTKQLGVFDEFGMQFPARLMLAIQDAHGRLKTRDFGFTPTQEPVWRYIPKDIHAPAWGLRGMVRHMFVQPQ